MGSRPPPQSSPLPELRSSLRDPDPGRPASSPRSPPMSTSKKTRGLLGLEGLAWGDGCDIVALGRVYDRLVTPRGHRAARTLKPQGPRRTAPLVSCFRLGHGGHGRLSGAAPQLPEARPDFRLRCPWSPLVLEPARLALRFVSPVSPLFWFTEAAGSCFYSCRSCFGRALSGCHPVPPRGCAPPRGSALRRRAGCLKIRLSAKQGWKCSRRGSSEGGDGGPQYPPGGAASGGESLIPVRWRPCCKSILLLGRVSSGRRPGRRFLVQLPYRSPAFPGELYSSF